MFFKPKVDEAVSKTKSTVKTFIKKAHIPQSIAEPLSDLANYQEDLEYLIEKKAPEKYKELLRHALNLGNFAVGFIPGSQFMSILETFNKSANIRTKIVEQKNYLPDPQSSLTYKELQATITEANKEMKLFLKNQKQKKFYLQVQSKMKSSLLDLLNREKDEELNEKEILTAIFEDLTNVHAKNKQRLLQIIAHLNRQNNFGDAGLRRILPEINSVLVSERTHFNSILSVFKLFSTLEHETQVELSKTGLKLIEDYFKQASGNNAMSFQVILDNIHRSGFEKRFLRSKQVILEQEITGMRSASLLNQGLISYVHHLDDLIKHIETISSDAQLKEFLTNYSAIFNLQLS